MKTTMRRFLSISFLCLASALPLAASPWVAGYRVALDGFDVPSRSVDEYWALSVSVDVIPSLILAPSVDVGLSVPSFPHDGEVLVTVGAGSGLLVWHEHPLRNLFRRQSAYVPRIDVSVGIGFSDPYWRNTSVLFQPLRFHFGDKQVGILGLHLVHERQSDAWGWGLRLFEIHHYLW